MASLTGMSSLVPWWAWVLTLDGPHLFATVSRTYLDRRERQTHWRLPFELFLAAANLWACEGAQWSPERFSPASTRSLSRFWEGGSGQVANGVKAQGGL